MKMTLAIGALALAGLSGGLLMGLGDDNAPAPKAEKAAAGKEKALDTKKAGELTVANGADLLKADVGVWDCEVTFWFTPDAPPVKTTCTMTSKLTLDGMYREDRLEGGTFGPAMGNKAWSTISYTGYNASTKQVEAVRMSSTNSTMIVVRGGTNADGHLELAGEYMFMGGKATSRDVTHVLGPGHQRVDSYMSFGGGPEFKGFQIEMKLRK